ncbi:MAG: helix-hairpin-helix domain-containing protein [Acidobacteriales bacterium]|nr:helix-hairpin-helix domain-containing protein [Terriglobales bacterium]
MKLILPLMLLQLAISGCTTQSSSPDQIRERTANATATATTDAKAIAQGVKEGLSRNSTVNINTATKEQLTAVPTIDDERASRIIANRPYGSANELVTKHVMPKAEYDKIAGHLTAK